MDVVLRNSGGGYYGASVTKDGRVDTSARSNPRTFYISRDNGRVFNAVSVLASAAAGNYVFYIENTSQTRDLYLSSIEFHSDNDVKWFIWEVTGTAVGTTIDAKNMNLGSGFSAEADIYGDAAVTGLSVSGRQIGTHRSQAAGDSEMSFGDALILTPGTAIAVEYEAGTTGACEIDCFFYFEPIITE